MALPLSPQPGHFIVLSAALAVMIAVTIARFWGWRDTRNFWHAGLITIGFGIGVSLILGLEQYGVPVVG